MLVLERVELLTITIGHCQAVPHKQHWVLMATKPCLTVSVRLEAVSMPQNLFENWFLHRTISLFASII